MDTKKSKTIICIILAMTYFVLWYLTSFAYECAFHNDLSMESTLYFEILYRLNNYLNSMIQGLIVFLFPFEYFSEWVFNKIGRRTGRPFICINCERIILNEVKQEHTDIILLTVAYLLVFPVIAIADYYYRYGYLRCETTNCFRTFIVIALMIRLYDLIKEPIQRFVVSNLMLVSLSTLVNYLTTHRFINAFLLAVTFIVTWHYYDFMNSKSISFLPLLGEIFAYVLMGGTFILVSGHLRNWLAFINPYGYADTNYSSRIMVLIREGVICRQNLGIYSFFNNHPLIILYRYLKFPAFVCAIVLIFVVVIMGIILAKIEERESKRRACLCGSVIFLFAIAHFYWLLTDLGIVPSPCMTFVPLKWYYPIMMILFRALQHGKEYTAKEYKSGCEKERRFCINIEKFTQRISDFIQRIKLEDYDDTDELKMRLIETDKDLAELQRIYTELDDRITRIEKQLEIYDEE